MLHLTKAVLGMVMLLSLSLSASGQAMSPTIGDSYAGGIVFYLDGKGGGLVAAPADQAAEANWLGALKLCAELVAGGFGDWRLPAVEELALMYNNLASRCWGGFAADWYWSSVVDNDAFAWAISFADGERRSFDEYNKLRVRALRNF
jgi:hypothetical protein